MCFSATASFTTAAILSLSSIISIYYARRTTLMPLALIPLLFAIQQYAEGILWLSDQIYINPVILNICMYTFLVIALVGWPLWIPYSTIYFSKEKITTALFMFSGIATAFSFTLHLLREDVIFRLQGCHITYSIDNSIHFLIALLYVMVTITPFLNTTMYHMKLLGISILVSVFISYIFYWTYFMSVWCFFAALLSSFITWIIYHHRSEFRVTADS